MKNIHVLPTDKPSILGFDSVKNLHFVNDFIDDYQNIYITNSEEIKEGDWCYSIYGFITQVDFISAGYVHHVGGGDNRIDCYKKIILTTDTDLIKDGVQAIDDKFLEWFVKNPSCDFVEVEKEYVKEKNDTGWVGSPLYLKKFNGYKIIIPKEEPKQENDYTALLKPVGTKQETFKEVRSDLLTNLIKLNERAIKENWKMKDVGFEFFKVFAYSESHSTNEIDEIDIDFNDFMKENCYVTFETGLFYIRDSEEYQDLYSMEELKGIFLKIKNI